MAASVYTQGGAIGTSEVLLLWERHPGLLLRGAGRLGGEWIKGVSGWLQPPPPPPQVVLSF